jgi:AraC-like DNA-binding protein
LDVSIKLLRSQKGDINLLSLYKYLGIDKSTLEKKFKQKVGITPKNLAAIYRFNHAVALKSHKPSISFTQISYECGYYDQAHLIRDFSRFTGQSPSSYFKKKYRFTEIFSAGLLDGMFY